jgi:hypothetical protein
MIRVDMPSSAAVKKDGCPDASQLSDLFPAGLA